MYNSYIDNDTQLTVIQKRLLEKEKLLKQAEDLIKAILLKTGNEELSINFFDVIKAVGHYELSITDYYETGKRVLCLIKKGKCAK